MFAISNDPVDLRREAEAWLRTRERSVWDARRLLRPVIGQVVPIVIDDGQHAAVRCSGVLLDCIHSPSLGFALKMKGVARTPGANGARSGLDRRLLRRVSTIPITQIRPPVHESISFLLQPAADWPLPPAWVSCPRCIGSATGRFCSQCGAKVRSGFHPGEGFSAEQAILRASGVAVHRCGAALFSCWHYCPKCGVAVG